MEKPKKSNSPSHRRLVSLDVKKSSSSLNVSTSSLRSINEDREIHVPAGRRSTVVRFAPTPAPPSSSSSVAAATRRSSLLVSKQAPNARPATAARLASASGPKARSSLSGSLPESGPKAIRRSWGGLGGKEMEDGDGLRAVGSEATATQVRSSSVPRRMPTEEKPLQKRESKSRITSRKSNASPKLDVLHKPGTQRSPNNAIKTSEKKAPSNLSLNNMAKVSPPRSTSAATIGASWESLPSDLQSLGSEIMSYRDAAEMAAVEALQEASAAEIVLRCLSAFADLAASSTNQSPQQTVDEFLALQAALTPSTAVLSNQQQGGRHAGDWLRAAVTADLAPFSLYSTAPSSPKKSSGCGASPAVSPPATTLQGEAAAASEETWLETAARELGEEMRAWFVGYVERLLNADVAGTLGQCKRVNDWLDAVGTPSEAVEQLRKKIFGYLLDHVESAVVALNGGVAPNQRK